MKIYTFPYGGSFGPGDSWDGFNEVELTDKEAERLEASAAKESRWRLDEDPEIGDIYNKVYRVLYMNEIAMIMDDEYRMREIREDYESEYGKRRISDKTLAEKYMDNSTFNVNYPEELQS